MKSLDLWLLAINKYENNQRGYGRICPFEGSYAGFVLCLQEPEKDPNLELLNIFLKLTYKDSSKEWSEQKQANWLFALIEINAFHLFSVKEEGCLLARKMMFEGKGELREKAVAAWTVFTKLTMQAG
jgi:hypothetical protein